MLQQRQRQEGYDHYREAGDEPGVGSGRVQQAHRLEAVAHKQKKAQQQGVSHHAPA
ncbi:hypothetical protein D3C81_2005560 [compost metagenome]